MSACLIITQGDNMFIGADSACSVKTNIGFKRCSDDVQKLFCIGEQILFCSGNMNNVYECVNWITNQFTRSICIEELKEYLVENHSELLDEYYNVEILIVDYTTKVVYQLSQYNNFDIITYPYSKQTRVICGGYKTSELFSLAKNNILMKKSIHDIYFDTYNDITDECLGGYLYLYSSPIVFSKSKLIEKNIQYMSASNCHLLTSEFVTSGFINGSQIIGGEVYSENYSPDSGTYLNLNNGVFSLGGGKIKYDGNILSLSGVTLKWDDVSDAPTALSAFKNDTDFQTADQVTTITENTIATTNVIAKNLHVQSANIDGEIVADSVAAENITGTTFAGKTIIVGGEDNGDGSIIVKDKDGIVICTIDKNGINVKSTAFVLTEGIDIIKGTWYSTEYAPNLIEYADGYNNVVGSEGSVSNIGTAFVGGIGSPNANNQYWGVDTGDIDATNYKTLKFAMFVDSIGVTGTEPMPPILNIYGDDGFPIVTYNSSNGDGIIFTYSSSSDTSGAYYDPVTTTHEVDISAYDTIRVECLATNGEGVYGGKVSIGLTYLYLC